MTVQRRIVYTYTLLWKLFTVLRSEITDNLKCQSTFTSSQFTVLGFFSNINNGMYPFWEINMLFTNTRAEMSE